VITVPSRRRELSVYWRGAPASRGSAGLGLLRVFGKARAGRGQSMLEFALVIPVLIMILVGVLEVGWTVYTAVALTNAAYDGAAYIADATLGDQANLASYCTNPVTSSKVLSAVQNELQSLGSQASKATVTCVYGADSYTYTRTISSTTTITSFQVLTVTVNYAQGIIGPYPVPFSVLTLTRSVQARVRP
jgi:Flp pilus assembly protein TadG